MDATADLEIRKLESKEEVDACSLLMSRTDPWLTLGQTPSGFTSAMGF